jgi:hypothetical protein
MSSLITQYDVHLLGHRSHSTTLVRSDGPLYTAPFENENENEEVA